MTMTAPVRTENSSTTSSTVTMLCLLASTHSFCTPVIPQYMTLPSRSACWAWMIPTSGLMAGTAVSSSPVNGHEIAEMVLVWSARLVPTYPRSTPKGSPAAPTRHRSASPAWECSSNSRGRGYWFSTASRIRCNDPTPGLPPQEKISLPTQPAPMSWSYTISGVIRTRVKSRRPWRMISWPAANGMRWVKPSRAII